jgi:hypothetical protein
VAVWRRVCGSRLLEAIVAVAAATRPGFDADEVAFALAWTQSAARSQVEFGRYLIRVVPEVFAALTRGAVDVRVADIDHTTNHAAAGQPATTISP